MSTYGICRVQKCKGSAVGAAQYHNDREPGKHKNKDIDPTRTHLNFEYVPHGEYEQEIEARIKAGGVTRKVRHDAVKLAAGICTASPSFFQGLTQQQVVEYFDDCFSWACNYFGKSNMVAFTVHMDETTPHAHWEATPIKDGHLAWNAIFKGGNSYTMMQNSFYEEVSKKWGLERGEVGSGRKHKSVVELKNQTHKELNALQADKTALEGKVEDLRAEVDNKSEQAAKAAKKAADAIDRAQKKEQEVENVQNKLDSLKTDCDSLSDQKESLQQDVAGIEKEQRQEERNSVQLDAAINSERTRLAPEPIVVDETTEASRLDADIARLEAAIEAEKGKCGQLDAEASKLERDCSVLAEGIAALRERIKELPSLIERVIEKLPMPTQVKVVAKRLEQQRAKVKPVPVKRKAVYHGTDR